METEHHTKSSIEERILKRIRAKDLTMRPRAYFVVKIAALVVVLLLVLAISVLIFNFISFSIRINGHDSLLHFGPRGILVFLTFFPWPLLVIDIGLIAFLQWMVRQFRFGYTIPILYLLGAIVTLTLATGLALDRTTPLNDRLLDHADHDRLPAPFGELYEGMRRPPRPGSGECKCTITAIDGATITAEDRDIGTTTVVMIELPLDGGAEATTTGLAVGDTVFVVGDQDGDVIHAFGIRKFDFGHAPPSQH